MGSIALRVTDDTDACMQDPAEQGQGLRASNMGRDN